MTTLGFVGLGIMGLPMAANIAAAGFDVAVHNPQGRRDARPRLRSRLPPGAAPQGVTTAAREAGVVIPLGAAVAQLVAAAVARGDGGLDHSGLLRLVEELSGRAHRPDTR
jgi:3-hydroxyisobutyrate dehydrogenase-like beta-hydroxyacid dehydrogenase